MKAAAFEFLVKLSFLNRRSRLYGMNSFCVMGIRVQWLYVSKSLFSNFRLSLQIDNSVCCDKSISIIMFMARTEM